MPVQRTSTRPQNSVGSYLGRCMGKTQFMSYRGCIGLQRYLFSGLHIMRFDTGMCVPQTWIWVNKGFRDYSPFYSPSFKNVPMKTTITDMPAVDDATKKAAMKLKKAQLMEEIIRLQDEVSGCPDVRAMFTGSK